MAEPSPERAARPAVAERDFGYSAPLDGIRAVAILAVLLFHIHPALLPGGFTGVDVFYVLSGFLITSIIVSDLRTGRFSLREFYLRRVQRLAPNAILTVLVVVLLWWLLLLPSQTLQSARHGLWALFNVSNIFVWTHMGRYWDDAAEWAPLTHTWSLGIEEQFYLLFPGFLLLLSRFSPRRIGGSLAALTVVGFAVCVVGTRLHPVAAFYLLPTRLWELLLGAALATVCLRDFSAPPTAESSRLARAAARLLPAAGWVGLLLVAAGFWFIDESVRFPGAAALIPTAGTALLIASAIGARSRLSALLSVPVLVEIGKISYSLYLWHWPMITLGKMLARLHGLPVLVGSVGGAVAGIVAGWTVYHVVERPLRRRGPGRRWRLAGIGAGFTATAACCLVFAQRGLAPGATSPFAQAAYLGQLYNAGPPDATDPTRVTRFCDMRFPVVLARDEAAWKRGGVIHRYGGPRPEVVVLGSSHALMFSHVVDELCRELSISVAFLGADGTHAFFHSMLMNGSESESDHFNDARRRYLREWHPAVVFIADRWDACFRSGPAFERELRDFAGEIRPWCDRMFFVTQAPVAELGEIENLREVVAWRISAWNEPEPRLRPDAAEPIRRQVTAVAEAMERQISGLHVLRADQAFYRPDGTIRYTDGREFFFADDDHLSEAGAQQVRGLFRQALTMGFSRGPDTPIQ